MVSKLAVTNQLAVSPVRVKRIANAGVGRNLMIVAILTALMISLLQAHAAQQHSVNTIRLWHSPSGTRIVFDVSADVSHKLFTLENPHRLVVDIKHTKLLGKLPLVEPNDIVEQLRTGAPSADVLRIVFDLKQAVSVNSFLLSPNELYGHRLVVDVETRLSEAADTTTGAALDADKVIETDAAKQAAPNPSAVDNSGVAPAGNESATNDSASKPQASSSSASDARRLMERSRDFVVAIDAGHGGEDPGALGHSGSKEKFITLAIAQKLKAIVDADKGMSARLIRTGDYFINLQQRRLMAREQGADVFVSIHADAFSKRSARGFSVFALSQRGATSAMASALADKENASDLIGGVSLADKDEVLAKVLVDLSMNNTISESVNMGGRVLKELSSLGHLHSKRVEQAGFVVLGSADMPSILVETGFITNPTEEQRLRTPGFQQSIAHAIYTALYQYRQQTPYFANADYVAPNISSVSGSSSSSRTTTIKHTVKRGDTLSELADRYGTSVRRIMQSNKLKRDTAVLGQVLRIETSAPAATANSGSTTVPDIHTVVRGDSLSKISAQYNITMRALRSINNLSSDRLKVGQKIKLGGYAKSTPLAAAKSHRVKSGDTLSDIAMRYKVSMNKIKNLNQLSGTSIRVGQVLKLR